MTETALCFFVSWLTKEFIQYMLATLFLDEGSYAWRRVI